MQFSRKHVFFAGGLAGFVLILLGEVVGIGSDSCSPSFAAVLEPDCYDGYAVSTPSATYVEKNSDGKGELEEQLRMLLEQLKRLEKDAEEKFQKDILPYLKREIEKLRDRLKEFSPDKEEAPRPQRIQA